MVVSIPIGKLLKCTSLQDLEKWLMMTRIVVRVVWLAADGVFWTGHRYALTNSKCQ